jgi:hypothetical protein
MRWERLIHFIHIPMNDRTAIILQKEFPLNLTLTNFRAMEVFYSKRSTTRGSLRLLLKELRFFLKRKQSPIS